MRSIKDYVLLYLKGMGMGAADVVPGVSGGTIAFISGIYEELIESINAFNLNNLKRLFSEGFGSFWKSINGNFLAVLFAGVFTSILSLAKLISICLEHYGIATWSFFFGLVVASIPLVWKQIKVKTYFNFLFAILGALIAYWVINIPPTQDPGSLWYLALSGMIAICAMILPGISGSFLLIILGSYITVLQAVNDRDIIKVITFLCGAGVGLLSFSRLLKWLFAKYHDLTVATLTGFLVGSLAKIWPWKHVSEWFIKHEGEVDEEKIALVTDNVSPFSFAELTGQESFLGIALAMALIGFAVIWGLERTAKRKA